MVIKNWKLKIGFAIAFGVGIIVLVVLLLTLVFNRCNKAAALPKSLEVSDDFQGNTRVSWSGLTISSNCDSSYLMHYIINGGRVFEIPTTLFTYNITNSPLCSDIYFQLWTVNETGELSDESLDLNYTVLSPSAYMTHVVMTRTDAGLIGSWQKSEMYESCKATYKVHYSTEFGDYHYSTVNESHMISEDIFCFDVRMEVATVIGFGQTSYSYPAFGYAEDIKVNTEISPEDKNILIATWSHSKQELCTVTYNVTRSGQEEQWFIVLEPIINFEIVYCVEDSFTITPIAFGGTYIGQATTTDITQYPDPELIGLVKLGPFTQQPDMLIISWIEVPQPIPGCVVTYQIHFASEFGNVTQYSTEPIHQIFRRYFCFYLEIEIQPVIDSIMGRPTRETYRYDIDPVMNLEITSSAADTLTATWRTSLWQMSCDIEYVVTYEHGSIRDSFITQENRATFNRSFCGNTTISVKIVYDGSESEESSETYTTGSPSTLQPLENVQIEVIETTGVVSWDLSESVSLCPKLYIVNVRNEDLKIKSRCSGSTGCIITLSDFCPYIDLKIRPRYALGEVFNKTYFCNEFI